MQRILVNGGWVEAVAEASFEIKNPATLIPLATVPDCGAEDIRRAVAAAQAAQPAWSKIPGAEKGKRLREIGERIRAHADVLATLVTQETGTPLCESLDCVGRAAACFAHHADVGGEGRARFGVVATMSSSALPLLMARMVAPAIAAGSTVVCQAPQPNPLSFLKLAELCELLPPGVINVITGGPEAESALIDHPDINLVAFRGPLWPGRPIAAALGTGRKELDLGISPVEAIIVLNDADLGLAVPGVAWARLHHAGQDCSSSKRIYVERSIAAEFADRLHEYVAFLEVGDPRKPETDLGPLVSHEAMRRVEDQVAHAAKNGARLKLGGRGYQPWGLSGHFFQPTLLTDVRHGSHATRDEMRGPVLLITPVEDAAEAIRFAKDYGPGLQGSVYTRTPALAARVAEGCEAAAALEHITARKPWWFPYRDRGRQRRDTSPSDQT